MRQSLAISLRIFRRSLKLVIPFLLMLIASTTVFVLQNRYDALPLSSLTKSLQVGVFGFLYFAFASYELLSLSSHVGGKETLSAIPSAERKLCASQLLVLLFPLFVWTLIIVISHFTLSSPLGNHFGPYILNVVLSCILYCFLQGLTGMLLGAALSRLARPLTYVVILIFALLVTPLPMRLYSAVTVSGFEVASLLDWFMLGVPNTSWAVDTVYGVAVETSRWILIIFWCFLFLSILAWQYRSKKSLQFISLMLTLILVTVGAGTRFALRSQDSIQNKDLRPYGFLDGPYHYYLDHTQEDSTAPDFSITHYDLRLSIGAFLEGTATIKLSPNLLPTYAFTLAHNYSVRSVTNENNEPLTFERDGDLLTVHSAMPISDIIIDYSGSNGKYYANWQGIVLPGYSAYYPLPGRHQLWNTESVSMLPVILTESIPFQVQVNTSSPVFSNLPRTADNTFAGITGAVTLYAGIITEKRIGDINYIYSPLSGQDLNINAGEVTREIDKLKDILGIDVAIDVHLQTVVMQPFTIAAGNGRNERVVALSDHLLLCDLNPTSAGIGQELFSQSIPITGSNSYLRQLFLSNLSDNVPNYEIAKPAYEDLQILKQYKSHSEILDEQEWMAYIIAVDEGYSNLFMYQKQTLGAKQLLSAVYSYLTQDNPEVHPLDFLYYLEVEDHD